MISQMGGPEHDAGRRRFGAPPQLGMVREFHV